MKLSTIVLMVRSLEDSIPFYRDLLDLPLRGAQGNWAFFDLDGICLALQQGGRLQAHEEECRSELVFNVEDIDADHAALAGKGIEFFNAIRQFTSDQFGTSFRDPDGHCLTLMGPRRQRGEST